MRWGAGLCLCVLVGLCGCGFDRRSQPNQRPIAFAGADKAVRAGAQVSLHGTAADDDGDALTVSWSQVAGEPVVLSDTAALEVTFAAPATPGTLVFRLSARDGIDESEPSLVRIAVANDRPTAYAGTDQTVGVGTSVTLSGSGDDRDGDALSFRWAQIDGEPVALSDDDAAEVVFAAPAAPTTLAFSLVVSDGFTDSEASLVRVAVVNAKPLAFATGPSEVYGGAQVTLRASGQDADGHELGFAWAQLAGEAVTLSSVAGPEVTFTAPQLTQTLVFSATASDGFASSDASLVYVDVRYNRPPVPRAGGLYLVENLGSVQLDGGASSDPEGDPITSWTWTVAAGPAGSALEALLSGADTKLPVFSPDEKGTYTLALVVSDGVAESLPDFAVVESLNNPPATDPIAPSEGPNLAPIALSAPATATDADGDSDFSWSWSVSSFPSGAFFELQGASTSSPVLIPEGKGTYVLSVVVSDGEDASPPAVALVRALNNPPVVDVDAVRQGLNAAPIGIGAFASDPDNDLISYIWTVEDAPEGATWGLSGATTSEATFTPRGKGLYDVVVTAGDGAVTASDRIVVEALNNPPVADAGDDLPGVGGGSTITLDASRSFDVDGDELTYTWSQRSGPAIAALPSGMTPDVVLPAVKGTIVLELVAFDGEAASNISTVTITMDSLAPVLSATSPVIGIAKSTATVTVTANDDDGDAILAWQWAQVDNGAPAVTLTTSFGGPVCAVPCDASASFPLPAYDPYNRPLYELEARAFDGIAWSQPVRVSVETTPNDGDFIFVSSSRGSDGNPGTSRAAPKKSIGNAVAAANGQKPLLVAGESMGNMGEGLLPPGTKIFGRYDPVTWQRNKGASSGWIMQGPGGGWCRNYGWKMTGGSLVLDGLSMAPGPVCVRDSGGNVYPDANGYTGAAVVYVTGGTGLTIRDSYFYGLTWGSWGSSEDAGPVAFVRAYSDNVVVENTLFYWSPDKPGGNSPRAHALLVKGHDVRVERNTFDLGLRTDQVQADAISVLPGSLDVTIKRNWIRFRGADKPAYGIFVAGQGASCGSGWIAWGQWYNDYSPVNVVIENNYIISDSSLLRGAGFTRQSFTDVRFNTVAGTPEEPGRFGVTIDPAGCGACTECATMSVHGNLFAHLSTGISDPNLTDDGFQINPLLTDNVFQEASVYYREPGSVDVTDLAVLNGGTDEDPGNSGNQSLACFDTASALSLDFMLKEGSACLDVLDCAGAPEVDLWNQPRPSSGVQCDPGADELVPP